MTSPVSHRPLVIAHRGLHGAPGLPFQNTLGAYAAAYDAGADMVELDVRRTRDGVLVLHHDPVLADGRRIADIDFADLPRLPDGQRIPTLVDALALVRRRGRQVVIELKEQGYELQVARIAAQWLPNEQFRFLSFEPAAMHRIERAFPHMRTGLVIPWVPDWLRDGIAEASHVLRSLAPMPLADARRGVDYLIFYHPFATDSAIDEARRAGLEVYVTTLDTPDRLERFMWDPRITGVMTNRADVASMVREAPRAAQVRRAALLSTS